MIRITRGRQCPRCGVRTTRAHAPALMRLVRLFLRGSTWRRCKNCKWQGFGLGTRDHAEAE